MDSIENTAAPRPDGVSSVEWTAETLCEEASYRKVYHRPLHDEPMLEGEQLPRIC